MLLGNCNIWGSGTLYGTRIYTEPCYILDAYDFGVALYDLDTNLPIQNISWELYRRDNSLGEELVTEYDILVAYGIEVDGVIQISLSDYQLRHLSDDYYLKSWKTNDHNYIGRLRIKYLATEYVSNEANWPYIRDTLQAQKKVVVEGSTGGSSGGMGGSVVTHTEYRDKPLPVIKVMCLSGDIEDEEKEIWIVDFKDFDSL